MPISNGPITQTAWVTADIAVTEEFLTEHFGAGKWTRIPDVPFGPDTSVYRGAPADFTAHISLAYLGDLRFAYLDGAAAGVPFIELADVPDAMRAFYAQIKAGS